MRSQSRPYPAAAPRSNLLVMPARPGVILQKQLARVSSLRQSIETMTEELPVTEAAILKALINNTAEIEPGPCQATVVADYCGGKFTATLLVREL